MASAPIRLVIIAALAVVGVIVLSQAFPTVNTPGGGPGVQPTATPKESPKPKKSPKAKPTASPQVQGVKVAVFNGTTAVGLAGVGGDELQGEGYTIVNRPENAPTQNWDTTTIFYRNDQAQVDAEAMAKLKTFKGLDPDVKKLPSNASEVPPEAELAVYLGTDYASEIP